MKKADRLSTYHVRSSELMVRELRRIVRVPLNDKGRFKILLPVRLATFERIHVIGPQLDVIEHKAIKPSEIIYYKINNFLANNYSNETLESPQFTTLLSLLTHIADPRGYLKGMLDAMVGTNIANAYIIIKSWCMDKDIRIKTKDHYFTYSENSAFGRHLAISLLEKMWNSLLNGLDMCISNFPSSELSKDTTIISIANKFILLLAHHSKDHRILVEDKDISKEDFLNYLCISSIYPVIIENIKAMESGYKYSVLLREKVRSFNLVIKKYLYPNSTITTCSNRNDQIKFYKIFCNYLLNELETSIRNVYISFNYSIAKDKLDAIMTFFRLIINAIVELNKEDDNIENIDYKADIMQLPFEATIYNVGPSISRYYAGIKLLVHNIESEDQLLNECVVNLFMDNRSYLSSIPLNILYKIYSSQNYKATVGQIKGYLEVSKQIKENDRTTLAAILSTLTSPYNRLLYSTAPFYHQDINNIVLNDTVEFGLSAAGRSYLNELIITPPYLQWALAHSFDDILVRETFSKQLAIVLERFKELFNNDMKNIKSSIKRNPGNIMKLKDVMPHVRIPIVDIYIKSLNFLIPALASHFRNLAKAYKTSDIAYIKILFKQWIEFGNNAIKEIKNNFEYENSDWEVNLLYSDRRLSEIAGEKIYY
jgi:hypothetical protein